MTFFTLKQDKNIFISLFIDVKVDYAKLVMTTDIVEMKGFIESRNEVVKYCFFI